MEVLKMEWLFLLLAGCIIMIVAGIAGLKLMA